MVNTPLATAVRACVVVTACRCVATSSFEVPILLLLANLRCKKHPGVVGALSSIPIRMFATAVFSVLAQHGCGTVPLHLLPDLSETF